MEMLITNAAIANREIWGFRQTLIGEVRRSW
jgi:hypothetical protein